MRRGYFEGGDGEVKEFGGQKDGALRRLQSRAKRNVFSLCCLQSSTCLLAQLPCWAVVGNKRQQNLIVSPCALESPPSHLIPTFAYCECCFSAAVLDFISSRLRAASETAFQTAAEQGGKPLLLLPKLIYCL